MAGKGCRCLLLTANVGTLFEQYDQLSASWCQEIVNAITASKASFVALHLQETGGKHVDQGLKLVPDFLRHLSQHADMAEFQRCFAIFDDNSTSAKFTALSSIYFVRDGTDARLWAHHVNGYIPFDESQSVFFSKHLEQPLLFRGEKFDKDMYPIPWTRKGYLQTRWQLNGQELSCVNVHLFHDASNLVAYQQNPSPYAQSRANAMQHVQICTSWAGDRIAYFGDFNYRLALQPFVAMLQTELGASKEQTVKDGTLQELRLTSDDGIMLSLKNKAFVMRDKSAVFLDSERRKRLLAYDNDSTLANAGLVEAPITFAPSYPYSEEVDQPASFLDKRCPGWCDRVMVTSGLESSLETESYSLVGQDVCMGDHKPVQLVLELA